jgi:hypothetical protein
VRELRPANDLAEEMGARLGPTSILLGPLPFDEQIVIRSAFLTAQALCERIQFVEGRGAMPTFVTPPAVEYAGG